MSFKKETLYGRFVGERMWVGHIPGVPVMMSRTEVYAVPIVS